MLAQASPAPTAAHQQAAAPAAARQRIRQQAAAGAILKRKILRIAQVRRREIILPRIFPQISHGSKERPTRLARAPPANAPCWGLSGCLCPPLLALSFIGRSARV